MSGDILDAWALRKPANYTAPTPKARQSLISSAHTASCPHLQAEVPRQLQPVAIAQRLDAATQRPAHLQHVPGLCACISENWHI